MELRLGEAGELASAWACALAGATDTRILIIKGPSLAHFGIRAPRLSADVDVLVEPTRFEGYCTALTGGGWQARGVDEIGKVRTRHSISFTHPRWPCDIDVHRHFPGFLQPAHRTFDALWESRESMNLAHAEVPVPGRHASILIAFLHQLRNGPSNANAEELGQITRAAKAEPEPIQLLHLAKTLSALEPLRDVMGSLDVSPDSLPETRDSPRLREWRARSTSGGSGLYFWLLRIQRAPIGARVGLLMQALWPPRSDLLITVPDMTDTPSGRLKARALRILKGLRGVPRAIRALRYR